MNIQVNFEGYINNRYLTTYIVRAKSLSPTRKLIILPIIKKNFELKFEIFQSIVQMA